MVVRQIFLRKPATSAVLLAAATTTAATYTLTTTPLRADAPPQSPPSPSAKKPIYDSPQPIAQHPHLSKASSSLPKPSTSSSKNKTESSSTNTPSPRRTVTSRVTTLVKDARLSLYPPALHVETTINNLLTRGLRLEHSFTTTIADLAPPASANERFLPHGLSVLITAMTASIATRNRNFVLRGTVPLAAGVVAGWVAVPKTMENVASLIWGYEERVPWVAETHLQVRDTAERWWVTGRAHAGMLEGRIEEAVGGLREGVEGWVRKK